jgi:formate-nitrite transporter family protein
MKRRKDIEEEATEVEERTEPIAPVIYEVVRRHGEEEMGRPAISLWWSGVAAGLSISFSVLAQAVLTLHLPDTPSRPLLAAAGYPLGFLMVVLGRQQLFTENTITIVLPVMAEKSAANLRALGRVWSIVLAANMAGTLLAAAFCSLTPVVSPETLEAMRALGRDLMDRPVAQMFFYAGYLIANMVWMKPSAEGNQLLLVVVMTYLVAIAGAAHIVAGSVEAFLLVIAGELGVGEMLWRFTIPVLAGNIVGGTALFAMLSYAQVMKEIRP